MKPPTGGGGGGSWIYFYFSLGMGPSDSAWLVDGFGRFDLILTNFDLILIVLTTLSKITNKCNTTLGGRGSGYIFILAKAWDNRILPGWLMGSVILTSF